jgi:cell division protein FtsQ
MTTAQPDDARPRSRMDPRIRQRRIAVRRDEGRRRLKLVVAALALVAAIAIGIGVTRSPLLDLDHIRVAGADNAALADLTRATGLHRGQAMVDLDEAGLARKAMALPWVRTAKVTRRWPDTVVVTITARVPVAAVPADGGGWALTDRTGRVMARALVPPPGVPTLAGVPAAGAPGTNVATGAGPSLTVALALPPALRDQVAAIAPDGAGDAQAGDVALQLRSGAFVRLGGTGGLPGKLDALATVLRQVDLARLAVIDVRVPESPAIRRS